MDKWIERAAGRMHVNKITQTELAKHIGIRRDYLSKILNGRIAPKGAEERITAAIDRLLADRKNSVTK